MVRADERLGQLLALAAERRWSPLARELCDLLLYWPPGWPGAMHAPIAALFETALREADDDTQTVLAGRLAGHSEIPLKLMNAVYLAAPAPLRREILMRNELEGPEPAPFVLSRPALLTAARNRQGDFTGALARLGGFSRRTATAVLNDATGEALAVVCRGGDLDRAGFSAVALLRAPESVPLAVYDSVAPKAAALITADWRRSNATVSPETIAAAE
jgi:hypothetical protein